MARNYLTTQIMIEQNYVSTLPKTITSSRVAIHLNLKKNLIRILKLYLDFFSPQLVFTKVT